MDPLIKIQDLHRRFGDLGAVNGISFDLNRGEVLGLLGPNGAGKSTTMRILSGCLAPSSGRVSIDGFDLHEQPLKARKNLGYLPENPPLYPEMTVDEYLHYCAHLKAVPAAGQRDAVLKVKARCGLEQAGRRLIANLSKGYRQRLGIAQAIIHEPAIVILDEPTSGLDPNQILEIRNLIRELGKTCGVLLSTHILPEVQTVCDRVLIINNGQLVFSRDMKQLEREESQDMLIRLGKPPEPAALADLPGVAQVLPLEEGLFQLCLGPDSSPGRLAEQLVSKGWELQELTPRKPGLEQIFTRLTTTEINQ